jgi:thiamine pyrophosphate-dependent acetolactate synthase large subunit-like protein
MQAIRQIVDAERLYSFIDMPVSMQNTKVEIIILPALPEETPPAADYAALDKLCGSLHEYANPALISGEKTAWQTAAMEKAAYAQYAP